MQHPGVVARGIGRRVGSGDGPDRQNRLVFSRHKTVVNHAAVADRIRLRHKLGIAHRCDRQRCLGDHAIRRIRHGDDVIAAIVAVADSNGTQGNGLASSSVLVAVNHLRRAHGVSAYQLRRQVGQLSAGGREQVAAVVHLGGIGRGECDRQRCDRHTGLVQVQWQVIGQAGTIDTRQSQTSQAGQHLIGLDILRAHGGSAYRSESFTIHTRDRKAAAIEGDEAVVHLAAHRCELGRVDDQTAIDEGQIVVLRRAGCGGGVVAGIEARSPGRDIGQHGHGVAIDQPGHGKAGHVLLHAAVSGIAAVGCHRCIGRRDVQRAVGIADVVVAGRERATGRTRGCDVVGTHIGRSGTAAAGERHTAHRLAIHQPAAGERRRAQGRAQAVLRARAVGRDRQRRRCHIQRAVHIAHVVVTDQTAAQGLCTAHQGVTTHIARRIGRAAQCGVTQRVAVVQGPAAQRHRARSRVGAAIAPALVVRRHRDAGRRHVQGAIHIGDVVVAGRERATGRTRGCDVVGTHIGRSGTAAAGERHTAHRLAIHQPAAGERRRAQGRAQAVLRARAVGRDRQRRWCHRQRAVGIADVVVAGRERPTGRTRCRDVVRPHIAGRRAAGTRQGHMTHGFTIHQSTGAERRRTQGGAQAVLRARAVGRDRQRRRRHIQRAVGIADVVVAGRERATGRTRGCDVVGTHIASCGRANAGQGHAAHRLAIHQPAAGERRRTQGRAQAVLRARAVGRDRQRRRPHRQRTHNDQVVEVTAGNGQVGAAQVVAPHCDLLQRAARSVDGAQIKVGRTTSSVTDRHLAIAHHRRLRRDDGAVAGQVLGRQVVGRCRAIGGGGRTGTNQQNIGWHDGVVARYIADVVVGGRPAGSLQYPGVVACRVGA